MTAEYFTQTFRVKKIHNIRDFAYRLDLKDNVDISDLALLLNSLTGDAFFWSEGNILHATSPLEWLELLPEKIKESIKSIEKVKEGYLEERKLPLYTAFALFVVDFNKVLSSNFKTNPLFKKLRRRTRKGWNFNLWMKFLHEFSINYKFTEENFEYRIWRWFGVKPEPEIFLTLSFQSGVEITGETELFFKFFDEKTLQEDFIFRIRGTYRIGRLKKISPEGLFTLIFDGGIQSSVPKERVIPIFWANRFNWREKDRSKILNHLRLTPKVICKYKDLLVEAINKLLEPYMVQIKTEDLKWERIKVSTNVVVDIPVPEHEVVDYIFDNRKVYNAPFERLKVNLVDLALKSEKNKKLLRDSKKDFLENLTSFLTDLRVEVQIREIVFDKKLKEWNLETAKPAIEFLEKNLKILKEADFNIVVVPQPEKFSQLIRIIPVWNLFKKTLKETKSYLITDRSLKVFLKSQKRETKRRILFNLLKELFKLNGGSLYILDEPLPYGKIFVETDRGYEVYNLFGEPLETSEKIKMGEEDLLISFKGLKNDRTVFVDKLNTSIAIKRNLEDNRCLNAEKGIAFNLGRKSSYLVLSKETPFGYKKAFGIRIGENLNLQEVLKSLLNLSKILDF